MEFDLELYREFVEAEPGVTISYIDIAPERPVRTYLFVHGFGGNARQWQPQINSFAQQNHVIAIDLRGHGASSRSASISYKMDKLVADIVSVLKDAQAHNKVVVIGHSFGVAVATEYANRHAERISHLILIAGAGEYDIRWPYKAFFRLPPGLLAAGQSLANNFIDASLVSLQKIYFQTLRQWQGWDIFPNLKLPVLIILGNRDQALPQESYQRVADLIPPENSEVLRVDVSAHLVMLERRNAVNRAIDRFIESSHRDVDIPRWRSQLDIGSRGSLLKERPWLAYYESNVPATIHVPDHPLTRLLQRSSRRFPNRTALIESGRRLSYRKLYFESLRFANALMKLNINKQSRIMILLPNCLQLVIAYYGALLTGAVAVLGNPLVEKDGLVEQLNFLEAEILVTRDDNPNVKEIFESTTLGQLILTNDDDYAPWFHKFINKFREKDTKERSNIFFWGDFIDESKPERLTVEVKADDTAAIQFTGGVTGPPKGVMLTHKNLVANVLQMRAWFYEAEDGQESTLALIPISHIYGMTTALNFPISQGATCILLPQFRIDEVMRTIKKHQTTYFPGVPSIFMSIKDYPDVRKYNVDSVQTYLSSVSPLPIEVEEAFEKITRSHLIEAYGLTEASPLTHISPLNKRDKIGSIGLPLPSTEARIVDLESKRVLPSGQVGELLIRGPQVMQGYWQDEEATERAIDSLGWLSTGDIARMDNDGYFQIISKSQDAWHSSDGEAQFYPRDIEEVIYELPSVEEVIVILLTGRPIAFVKVKENSKTNTKTIIAYCRRRLPPELVPWRVIFAGDFPRNLIGRVRREELIDSYKHEVNDAVTGIDQYLPGLKEVKTEEG